MPRVKSSYNRTLFGAEAYRKKFVLKEPALETPVTEFSVGLVLLKLIPLEVLEEVVLRKNVATKTKQPTKENFVALGNGLYAKIDPLWRW